MRIGVRVSPRSSGGGQVFVNELVTALRDTSAVRAASVFAMGAGSSFSVGDQIVVDVPTNPVGRQLLGDRALAAAVRQHPVDVLVCPGNEVAVVPGVPSILWPLTVAPFEESAMRRLGSSRLNMAHWQLLRRSLQRSVGRASGFVFSSHYARALYAERFEGVRTRPSTVIPPAASLRSDAPDVEIPGMPEDYVLFVSHLYPYKMVLETVRGYARAVDLGLTHDLVIAGRKTHPAYARAVRSLVAEEGLQAKVHFLGGVSAARLPWLYRRAALFVFPSISENAGSYALIDAFAFGTPVVSSGTSSMPEACQDAARYVDPRDPDQLGHAMHQILTDSDLRAKLSRASHARGAEYGDWNQLAESLVRFCSTLPPPTRGIA